MTSPLSPSTGPRLQVHGVDEALDVRSYSVDDGLSSLFSVDLDVMCQNPALDLEVVLGKEATFAIEHGVTLEGALGATPARRSWSGIVSEVSLVRSEATGLSTYQLTISPTLWLLTRRTNCRVFQQQSDLDVVRALLAEWSIEALVECTRAQKTRKYRVQYHETDFAFVSRLLEAAGVTYLFRDEDGVSKLVLLDAPESGRERESPLEHVDEPMGDGAYATQLRASRALRAGRVTLADHDHRLQNGPLVAESASSEHPLEQSLESFQYVPGAFRFGAPGPNDTPHADDRGRTRTDEAEGRRLAEQVGAAGAARARRFVFESNALDVVPGLRVNVSGHPMTERVGALLVTRTLVTGAFDDEPQLVCHAALASAPYRPDLVTPTPTVYGVESATVVGPAGETIHCDEFGRVRVQFHWDRYGAMNELSSCWVPVAQAWAGDGLGAINVPRVGQEVIVGFLAGNPEEPVVVGRVFTNLLRPPFPLPANKTQNGFRSASVPKTGGYNEIMFEDAAGKEQIRMRAERDMQTRVNHDQTLEVGRHRKARVFGDDGEVVLGKRVQTVAGDVKTTSFADRVAGVLGNIISMAGGQRVLETVGELVSSALSHRISSQVGTTLSVGASMIHIGPDSIVIQSPKILLNPGEEVASKAALTGETPSVGGPSA